MINYKLFLAITLTLLVIALIPSLKKPESPPPDEYEMIETDLFEEAVQIIVEHEGWHSKEHHPYIGYGHKMVKGEKYKHQISHPEAVQLVRKDLRKKCSIFREFGKDSLILGVLAYNIGEYKLIHQNGKANSNLIRKLQAGDRNVYEEYISFRRAWGKVIPSIERRRITEYNQLFDKTHVTRRKLNSNY